jgi:predicted acylesterase/phospholipase RssA
MAQTGEQSGSPFRNIALSLSGGGTRAVGYHLGTLDYLHRCGLLEQVGILSTVSGGTLVGASYVLSVEENISFQDLFFDFFEFFPKINMVEGLLQIMNRKTCR